MTPGENRPFGYCKDLGVFNSSKFVRNTGSYHLVSQMINIDNYIQQPQSQADCTASNDSSKMLLQGRILKPLHSILQISLLCKASLDQDLVHSIE